MADIAKTQRTYFKNGNLGIMDYYRMQNIQADTAMRETISKPKK